MKIDIHAHYIPDVLLNYIEANGDKINTHIEHRNGSPFIVSKAGAFPLSNSAYDMKKRIEDLDKRSLDKEVLSISPLYFFYDVDKHSALEICRLCNDWVHDFVKKCPERFDCMAMVPMQDIDLAIEELDRAHTQLGMNAVEIAPVINGEMLDEEKFFPFYEYCEKNNILIFLHPARSDRSSPYDKYYSINLVGYVEETNWAVTRLIFGGVFEKFPNLKILTSHAGGLFPYQFGRLMHGHEVRSEAKVNVTKSLENYVKNIYFDTITHWTPALQFLVDSYGADHVLMGTDYPYDMADSAPVDSVNALKLTQMDRELIMYKNTCELMGVSE